MRSKGQSLGPQQRPPPGNLGLVQGFKPNCNYVEDTLGNGALQCPGFNIDCHPPTNALAQAVVPDNGAKACFGTQNVRMLVMVRLSCFGHL